MNKPAFQDVSHRYSDRLDAVSRHDASKGFRAAISNPLREADAHDNYVVRTLKFPVRWNSAA